MEEIVFAHVNKMFSPDVLAIEDASFQIGQGEFVFLIGRSGSGKSTMLKLLSRQLTQDSGEIWVRGHEVGKLKGIQLPLFRRQFGIMANEMGLLSDRTVYENVGLAMLATEQPKNLIKIRVMSTLKSVGILHRAYALPAEISQGEAARALLARAIVVNPKILLADEPTANLDPDAAWDLMCLLDELNRLGVTVIVASHSKELVSIMKKRVIVLAAGRIVSDKKRASYDSIAEDVFEERRIRNERAKNK